MKRVVVWAAILLGIPLAVSASKKSITLPPDNPMSKLKPGPGVDVVEAKCSPCHSTDYIVRQPGSDAKAWGAEVRKMITVFGAPIGEADAKVIVDYLAGTYGPAAVGRAKSGKAGLSKRKPPGGG